VWVVSVGAAHQVSTPSFVIDTKSRVWPTPHDELILMHSIALPHHIHQQVHTLRLLPRQIRLDLVEAVRVERSLHGGPSPAFLGMAFQL
jgi:hypothetical protein